MAETDNKLTNLDPSDNFDAQQTAEEVEAGDLKIPDINVSRDYEASKEFSVSEIDRSGQGEQAATEATAPQLEIPQAEASHYQGESTSNPDDYREMAKEVTSASNTGVGEVDDDLVQKALEMSQPTHQDS